MKVNKSHKPHSIMLCFQKSYISLLTDKYLYVYLEYRSNIILIIGFLLFCTLEMKVLFNIKEVLLHLKI